MSRVESERSRGLAELITEFENVIGLDPVESVEANDIIQEMSKYLPNSEEALMRYASGFLESSKVLIKKPDYVPMGIAYLQLAVLAYIQADKNGVDVDYGDNP